MSTFRRLLAPLGKAAWNKSCETLTATQVPGIWANNTVAAVLHSFPLDFTHCSLYDTCRPQVSPLLVPLPCELVADGLLLDQPGLLVDLSQHLVHHAEQGTAHAQQLTQEHIVVGVVPDVRPQSCGRLTHTFQQQSRQHTHKAASTPRQTQQGNQGTWGLHVGAACGWASPTVQRRGSGAALVFLQEPAEEEEHLLLLNINPRYLLLCFAAGSQ